MPTDDARVLLCLCAHLPGRDPDASAPLNLVEWCHLATRLRHAGLSHPGELLHEGWSFSQTTGLEAADVPRLQSLLGRNEAWVVEMERLAERGISAATMADPAYPRRLRTRLRSQAPPVLFGAGAWDLLERPGLAIVGSRDVDEESAAFAEAVAVRCAAEGLAVVTGGAKGVDQTAMRSALERGGAVIGVLAGDLERAAAGADARRAMEDGCLLLLSPFHPGTGFTVGSAMTRNKLIYSLAEWGLVVASAFGQGGTWAGAREVLRHGWVPLFVRDGRAVPEGNRELLRPAALPFPALESLGEGSLGVWLTEHSPRLAPPAIPSQDGTPEPPCDLLPLVWPRLATFLAVPRSPVDVAEAFHIEPSQARKWLLRAEVEARVYRPQPGRLRFQIRSTRPAHQLRLLDGPERYVTRTSDEQAVWPGGLSGWPGPKEA